MLYISHINTDNTYSIKNTDLDNTTHLTYEELMNTSVPILGVFRYNNEPIEIHVVQPDDVSIHFNEILGYIKDEHIRQFAYCCKRIIPRYIFSVEASSTGKYHPPFAKGNGGLERHIISVCRLFNHIASLDSTKAQFNDTEIDLMLVACMMHDFLKSGWDEDYQKSKYTKFEHPLLAARAIRGMIGFASEQELDFIAHCIETHMGQWNKSNYSSCVLPVPSDRYQWLVHTCDYLSAKMHTIDTFNNTTYAFDDSTVVIVGDPTTRFREISRAEENTLLSRLGANIPKDKCIQVGITRGEQEVKDIWETIIKTRKVSEKQEKYIELAKII